MSLPAIHKDERPNQCFWNAAPVNARYFDAFGGTVSFVRLTFLRSGACGLSVPAARRAASCEPSRGSGGPATAARRLLRGGSPRALVLPFLWWSETLINKNLNRLKAIKRQAIQPVVQNR